VAGLVSTDSPLVREVKPPDRHDHLAAAKLRMESVVSNTICARCRFVGTRA
jgi:hypothetical protein